MNGPLYLVASNTAGDDFRDHRVTITINETGGPVRELTVHEDDVSDPEFLRAAIAACIGSDGATG